MTAPTKFSNVHISCVDGTEKTLGVYVDGVEIFGLIRVSWEILAPDVVARAVIELDGVSVVGTGKAAGTAYADAVYQTLLELPIEDFAHVMERLAKDVKS